MKYKKAIFFVYFCLHVTAISSVNERKKTHTITIDLGKVPDRIKPTDIPPKFEERNFDDSGIPIKKPEDDVSDKDIVELLQNYFNVASINQNDQETISDLKKDDEMTKQDVPVGNGNVIPQAQPVVHAVVVTTQEVQASHESDKKPEVAREKSAQKSSKSVAVTIAVHVVAATFLVFYKK